MPNERILEATDDNFEKSVNRSRLPVVVDFWAPWCGPCKTIAPILDTLADQYAGKVRVAKVNVDHNPKTAKAYEARSIPMVLVMYGGKVVEKQIGAASPKTFEGLFEKAAALKPPKKRRRR